MAGGVCIYGKILVLMASVFKPAFDKFHVLPIADFLTALHRGEVF
jgi:hypothetical protein